MGRRPKPGSEKAPLRNQPRISSHAQKSKAVPTANLQQALERSRQEERQSKKEERIEILKSSVHATTLEICEEVGQDPNMDVTFSYAVVRALGESAFHYIGSLSRDLEMFASHAKRLTVTTADVKMCARRSKSLLRRVSFLAEQLAEKRQASKPTRRAGSEEAAANDAAHEPTSEDEGVSGPRPHVEAEDGDGAASDEY